MTCKNCNFEFNTNFCPACGQKSDIHHITIGHVTHDFIHAFTHADKGFLLLVKELAIKPGIVAREYINGKRKKYFNPLSFLVITSAVSAFVLSKTRYFETVGGAGGSSGGRGAMHPLLVETFKASRENQKLFSLFLLVPLISVLSWLIFRKKKYNLAENFVLNSFIVGESHILRVIIFAPLVLLFPDTGRTSLFVFELILFIYLIVAYRQFFSQSTFVTGLKTLLIMPLYILLYWILIFIFVYLKHLIA